jgi:NitT/TauT family transport system substrate-binding protein
VGGDMIRKIKFFPTEPERQARRWATIFPCLFFSALVWAVSAVRAEAQEPTVYRLKWLFNVNTVGALYAQDHGYFLESGLEVVLKEGGPERDAIKELELGHAQFGVASADQVIRARAMGSPVVVIAQFYQVNPLQWIYRPGRIRMIALSDLRGKVLGITYGGNDETVMKTLLAMAGIDRSEVELFSVRYDYTPFFQKRVDLWPVYRNAQGVLLEDRLRQAGEETGFFDPAEFGVRFVANSLVTARKTADLFPNRVARFTMAVLRGWKEALAPSNEEEALDTLQRYDKDTDRKLLRKQLSLTRKMVAPEGAKIGAIDLEAWKQTERIMLDQRRIEKPVFVEQALRSSAEWIR